MKGYNGPSILFAALLFGAVLVSPTFADKEKVDKAELDRTNASMTGESAKDQIVDMKKVDDAELARTNASITGKSINKQINCVEKNGICQDMNQDRVTSDKMAAVSSPAESNTTTTGAIIDKSMMIGGKEAFQFGMSAGSYSREGGTITSVQPH
jgi:hypothetical protein